MSSRALSACSSAFFRPLMTCLTTPSGPITNVTLSAVPVALSAPKALEPSFLASLASRNLAPCFSANLLWVSRPSTLTVCP